MKFSFEVKIMHKYLGIALVVLAVAIAVVPIFTDCQSQDKFLTTTTGKTIPMKCHWTGITELGVAIPLLAVGVMITANRRRDNLRNLSVMGVILGALVISFPAGLIGVCQTPTMLCHTVMKPALMTFGSLAVVGSLGIMVLSRRGLS
jgi:hypothetical protein